MILISLFHFRCHCIQLIFAQPGLRRHLTGGVLHRQPLSAQGQHPLSAILQGDLLR